MQNKTTMTEITTTWCVYHLIHTRTPYQHIPKLLITEVPQNVKITEDIIERAGYLFGEFNIPWANHVLVEVDMKESPSDLVARIRKGNFSENTYAELVELAEEPI